MNIYELMNIKPYIPYIQASLIIGGPILSTFLITHLLYKYLPPQRIVKWLMEDDSEPEAEQMAYEANGLESRLR